MKPRLFIPVMLVLTFFFIQGCSSGVSGVRVVTEKIKVGNPNGDYITGKTEALDSVSIVPKIGGKVSEVAVDVGSIVSQGQVLLKIDMADLQGVRDQAATAVSNAQAGVEKAQLDLSTAKQNYDRAQDLLNSGALPEATFENQYKAPYDLAKLQAEKIAPGLLTQAQAALQTAEANYANSVITSPIDGEITSRSINPGETCSPTSPVFTVTGLSGIDVKAYVDDGKINSLKIGQKVAVKVDTVDGVMEAEVINISGSMDPTTKGYEVKFKILKADPAVKPGMLAQVYTDGSAVNQFVIPKTALNGDNGSYFVFVYNEGKVKKIPVQVARISDNYAVVVDGLADGQDLVVYSGSKLEDGASVKLR